MVWQPHCPDPVNPQTERLAQALEWPGLQVCGVAHTGGSFLLVKAELKFKLNMSHVNILFVFLF